MCKEITLQDIDEMIALTREGEKTVGALKQAVLDDVPDVHQRMETAADKLAAIRAQMETVIG